MLSLHNIQHITKTQNTNKLKDSEPYRKIKGVMQHNSDTDQPKREIAGNNGSKILDSDKEVSI